MGVGIARLQVVATMTVLLVAACGGPPDAHPTPGVTAPPVSPPGAMPSSTSPSPGSSPRAPAPNQSLIDAARRAGTVRVIVTLAMAYRPEGHLPGPEAVRRQRAEIKTAQGRLLEDLKPFHARLIAQYEHTPQLALDVDEAALRHLLASPLVASVQADTPQATS